MAPALFRFPPFALVDDAVQDLANVPPANVSGMAQKDRRQRSPQTDL